MSDQSRNFDPHAAARIAMILWSSEYAAQRGGSMDFWDSLTPGRKAHCATLADQVRKARPYTGPRRRR